jgi:hypothetical protein
MIRRTTLTATGVAAVSLALVLAPATSASAHQGHGGTPAHWDRTLTDQVLAPFQLAVARDKVYVADGFTSTISLVRRDGSLQTLATGPQPGEVAGLDVTDKGSWAYTASDYSTGATTLTIKRAGHADVVADLSGYEASANPDGTQTYGLVGGANPCAVGFFEQVTGGPATYQGIVESHPYSTVSLGDGSWAVADAAANAILRVDRRGHVSTLAVLPPQPVTITADMASALGAPDCIVGTTYAFEPVPTDVEVGRWGTLLVSTLPGGPEDPSLGARGSVYRVDRWSGRSTRVATGFAGATNVAMASDGTIFVTELFGGTVTQVRHGEKSTFRSVDQPVSVEVEGRSVYVGTLAAMDDQGNPTAPGTIRVFRR